MISKTLQAGKHTELKPTPLNQLNSLTIKKSPITILAIDDDPITIETIVGHLEHQGAKVIRSSNGEEGLEKFKQNRVDIVLTDLQMPVMGGMEVLSKIKDLEEEMPVIVVSGAGALSDSIEAFRLGAWDYIQKPIDFPQLINSISRAAERVKLMEENNRYRENLEGEIQNRTTELHNRTIELEKTNLQLQKEIEQRVETEKEKDRLEEEVQKAKNLESLGGLAGGIAHDFNNLLSALANYIDYAKLDHANPAAILNTLDNAKTVTKMAADLTQQLITFSKGGTPQIDRVNLQELITESIVPPPEARQKVDFNICLANSTWPIKGDKKQLSIVFRNIFFNSLESMPRGGSIEISTKNITIKSGNSINLADGDFVKITVKDEGHGISDNDIKRIFDPYFTTKGMGAQKGKGLGLAVSYSIIRKHGGNITISSTIDKGTSVAIYLPADIPQ